MTDLCRETLQSSPWKVYLWLTWLQTIVHGLPESLRIASTGVDCFPPERRILQLMQLPLDRDAHMGRVVHSLKLMLVLVYL